MKRKIIHIIGTIDPGGAEYALLNIFEAWKSDNFEHHVYYLLGDGTLEKEFGRYAESCTFLDWKSEYDLSKLSTLIGKLKEDKPDIVHLHQWSANYMLTLAAKIAGADKVVETIHDNFRTRLKGIILHKILRLLFNPLIDHSICVSREIQSVMTKKYFCRKSDTTVLHNGIKPRNEDDPNEHKPIGKPYEFSDKLTYLITIANLIPIKKGFEVLLKAIKEVTPTTPFKLLVIGNDAKIAPDFRADLIKYTEENNIADKVEFLGFRDDVDRLLQQVDMALMPSLYEGGPIVVLEAMRAGLPVIATRTGAVPEYIEDRVSGIIVETDDSEALASEISILLNDIEKQKTFGKAAQERFLYNFTIDNTVRALEEIYDSLYQ